MERRVCNGCGFLAVDEGVPTCTLFEFEGKDTVLDYNQNFVFCCQDCMEANK